MHKIIYLNLFIFLPLCPTFMLKYVQMQLATFVRGIALYTGERVVSGHRYLTGSSFDTRWYHHR
jgi:hypothetical protein